VLSKADRVLIAAYLLDKARPGQVLTLGELTLKAWELWPDEFGLTGYEELHPDSHHVRCVLYGRQKVVNRWGGLLKRTGPLRWELTEAGRDRGAEQYARMDAERAAKDAALQRQLAAANARKAERKAQEEAKELATNWPAY
jgi:hypothetical protein